MSRENCFFDILLSQSVGCNVVNVVLRDSKSLAVYGHSRTVIGMILCYESIGVVDSCGYAVISVSSCQLYLNVELCGALLLYSMIFFIIVISY